MNEVETPTELERLKALSSILGNDRLLVQAAGGNTSLKADGVMWIKASGTWLKEADKTDIFVPLDLHALMAAIQRDDPKCESCLDFVLHELNHLGLRPSIETSVHGLMSQRVVLHVHCVNTIAWAISKDPRKQLANLLQAYRWVFVPYARPGLQLSRAIRSSIEPDSNVLILQNHGLVVAADTVAEAQSLLLNVVSALEREVRPAAPPDFARLVAMAKGTDYHLPEDENCHAFATHEGSFGPATTQVFYPDHVVFLGRNIPADFATATPALAFRGIGTLVHKNAKPAVMPMLSCLSDVFRRLNTASALKPLATHEIDQLLNWDAEKYRQTLVQAQP